MKYSKESIRAITEDLLKDIKRSYQTEEELVINYWGKQTIPHTREIIEKCWRVGVPVEDDQFGNIEGSVITLYIDDDTGEIKCFQDSSMGRPIPKRAKKNSDGKYYLEVIA